MILINNRELISRTKEEFSHKYSKLLVTKKTSWKDNHLFKKSKLLNFHQTAAL